MVEVSFSIVTYNNADEIGCILESIVSTTDNISYKIFVVDNNSSDNTVEVLSNFNFDIELILLDKNIGFGKAHNKAIELTTAKYHVIVNPDIALSSNVALAMSRYMDENQDIALLTPKVLNTDGTVQILPKRNPKLIYLLSRRIGFKFLLKFRYEYEMQEKNVDDVFDIEFCTGCFMFVRMSVLEKTGGFDERYFMYFEDADLTRECKKHGRAVYNPNFWVTHRWERGGAKKIKMFLIQICSMFKFLRKWKGER